MRYRGNNICPDKRTNAADEQPENMTYSLTLPGGEDVKLMHWAFSARSWHVFTMWLVAWLSGLWPANFLCPALDLLWTGHHLCG